MTEERLKQIEERAAKATPGPWYAHATDDEAASNALYISTEPGSIEHHDSKLGMSEDSPDQPKPKNVIAITLLQHPCLAAAEKCDENSAFIASARTDVPRLVTEVRRLQVQVAGLLEMLKQK